MATALTPLANITLGSTASTITFSSISGSYRDLLFVINGGFSATSVQMRIQFNSDTGSNYSTVIMEGDGASSFSGNTTTTSIVCGYNYNVFSANSSDNNALIQILDYAQTDKHKSVLMRAGTGAVGAYAGRWASTSAITSVVLFQNGASTWRSGTSVALYGVSA